MRRLGLQGDTPTGKDLRAILTQAIEDLRPEPGIPPSSRSLRSYQVLFFRYVQQFTQRDVANQLGISPRQLRREQVEAIHSLALHLRARFGSSVHPDSLSQGTTEAAEDGNGEMAQEMRWLGDSLSNRVVEAGHALREALHLAQGVADRHDVELVHYLSEDLPLVAIAGTVLKQIALGLLTTAIDTVPGGRVTLDLRAQGDCVVLDVQAAAGPDGVWTRPETEGLEMASRLADLFHGRLLCSEGPGPLHAQVALPSVEPIVVLAIEDNADTLRLWERSVQHTAFRLVGLRETEQAIATAVRLGPDLIILDVMMPGIDGWELLGQLRNHPSIGGIPIIVCTVLPHKELALSLGASDFIRKPTTRQSFRALLRRYTGAPGPE